MRILVLASDNPNPPINGTRIRNYHLWPALRNMGHEVKVLALTRSSEDLKQNSEEIEFFTFTRRNLLTRIWMRLFHSYHEWPVSDHLTHRVEEIIQSWKPDIVHAEELRMGHYLPVSGSVLSVCAHNVESELIKKTLAAPFTFAVKIFNWIYQKNLVRFERKIFERADVRLTYSETDRQAYERIYPGLRFQASSNGVNLLSLTESEMQLPSPTRLLFLGSLSYLPNIEAIRWLLEEIRPKLKNPIELTVAGSTPGQIVKELLGRHAIPLLDTPLDLRPVYTSASALVVPLLSGSGTRGKILESLMYGRPVITTSKGIEGLDLSSKEGNIIADSTEDFARALDQWIESTPDHRQELAVSGRQAVASRYTWDKVGRDLLKIWNDTRSKSLQS